MLCTGPSQAQVPRRHFIPDAYRPQAYLAPGGGYSWSVMTDRINGAEAAQRTALVLSPDDEAPARARRLLRQLLGGRLDGELAAAELVVSELVTNAVLHGQRAGMNAVGLTFEETSDLLRIEVTDRGPGFTEGHPAPGDPGGWGLVVVGEIADRWGIERAHRGVRVWAELNLAPTASQRA
jgi:anti-sigma regulatory factor (Ser/Thr protein kinase)